MNNFFAWKKIGIFLLCVIIIYFSWNYFYQKDSIDSSITNQQSIQEKTKAEICFQEVSQKECYGSCSESECYGGVCPDEIQQAFCVCMKGVYEGKSCLVKGLKYEGVAFEEFRRGYYYGINKKEGTPANWVLSAVGTKSEGWYKPK